MLMDNKMLQLVYLGPQCNRHIKLLDIFSEDGCIKPRLTFEYIIGLTGLRYNMPKTINPGIWKNKIKDLRTRILDNYNQILQYLR